ncbi:hypothetical protein ACHRVZ_07970 [Flavobacterium sp. FlaQc-57]|uniref:hypothetical protein n=1 Tax=Flavobacterium sp. FlaQc-57 TaxID=3374186 RepID=UPI003758283B
MALSRKKYFIYIIFLVSPITLSLYAQSSVEKPTVSIESSKMTASNNQKNGTADVISILDNSNHFIVGLSNPKDSLTIISETKDQDSKCEENTFITATYSALAKDIIENYKYDFSETFIDILFFDRIDLARTRTI